MNIRKIIFVVVGILVIAGIFWYGAPRYEKWVWQKNIEKKAREFDDARAAQLKLIEADIYGGETPQETLQMFIDAVEAKNYKLASKYFVVEKQDDELRDLQNADVSDIENIMSLLKKTENFDGSYSVDKNRYLIRNPILVEYVLYPSGFWKIDEI